MSKTEWVVLGALFVTLYGQWLLMQAIDRLEKLIRDRDKRE